VLSCAAADSAKDDAATATTANLRLLIIFMVCVFALFNAISYLPKV
jgi:hypothetical protein